MAAKFPYMTSRKGSKNLYYKREVPPDLRATGRPTQIWRSLGSPDPVEAKTPYKKLDEEIDALFLSWRSGREAATSKNVQPAAARLSNAQIQRLCDAYYQRVIDDDFAWRSELWGKVKADPEGFINDKYIEHPRSEWYDAFYEQMTLAELFLCCVNEQHKRRLGEHQQARAVGDCAIHGGIADDTIHKNHLDVAPADRMRFIRKLIETEIAALEAILNKDSTRYDAITEKYDLSATGGVSSKQPTPRMEEAGPLLNTLVPAFLEEGRRAGLVKKTTMSDEADLREFVAIVGNKPIRAYTAADGTKYKDTLLAVPAQRKVKPFSELNIAHAAKAADAVDPKRTQIPRLNVDTLNDKLMLVRKFFRWADNREKQVPNPIDGLRIKARRRRGRKNPKRFPFTTDELQRLFHGPIYTGCKSLGRWKEPGALVPRNSARFWVPLIGLYTGMRLGEIIQLRVADIQTDDGIAYFDITTVLEEDDDEGDKSTKNENSVRQIPVHAMLFKIGFGEFVAARRKDGSARLFPDFNQSPTDGSWSKTFSAWFRHYRRHVGVERIVRGRNRVDFHSFRHVFEDTVRDLPDVKKEWRDALQGHGEGGSSAEYGTGVYRNRLNEAMQKVAFDVDFSHLMTPARQATR